MVSRFFLILFIALGSLSCPQRTQEYPAAISLEPGEALLVGIYEGVKASVVQVDGKEPKRYENGFTGIKQSGSGIVWDSQGHIITNYHVIEGVQGQDVRNSDGEIISSQIVGFSIDHDLAVLKIKNTEGIKPIKKIETAINVKVGQYAFAVGSPHNFQGSFTKGIISGLDRKVSNLSEVSLRGLIQTDASINPGNSGGPLLNSNGQMIGMNVVQVYSGLGLAIPIQTISKVVSHIIENGEYRRPRIGITINDSMNSFVLQEKRGAVIFGVERDSPAHRADILPAIKAGSFFIPRDIIIEANEKKVDSGDDLVGILEEFSPGDQITLKILRKGEVLEKTVKLY